MSSFAFLPSDEAPHPGGTSSGWTETWAFRAVDDDGTVAVSVVLVRSPAERRLGYWCAVVGRGRRGITVLEHDIAAPKGDRLELRASGIWADHTCETPFDHWSLGLEAFGLAFDDPADAVTSGRGQPVAVGFDLEWEDHGDPATVATGPTDRAYGCVGSAHGEILLGEEVVVLAGPGQRLHRWGTGPALAHWWSVADRVGVGDVPWAVTEELGRALAADRSGSVTQLTAEVVVDADGAGAIGWRSVAVSPGRGREPRRG